jgi:hypothetical protein
MATEKKEMVLLLNGKTGHGKSATGNSLLGEKKFKCSGNTTSETKTVVTGKCKFDDFDIQVTDTPGLEDTDLSKINDKMAAATNFDLALASCCGGVSAFILVMKYGFRLTEEETTTIDALKSIFGDQFLSHVIVVMTCGDSFDNDNEDNGQSFNEWCHKQKGQFQQLYQDCDGRVVLFNNFEKDETKKKTQRQRVVELVERINKEHGRYTHKYFKKAEKKREKMMLELEAPELIKQFQIKIANLSSDMEKCARKSSNITKEDIQERMLKLRKEIEDRDRGHGVLKELLDMMDNKEEQFEDVVKAMQLQHAIAAAKANSTTASALGKSFADLSVEVAKSNTIHGVTLGAASVFATIVNGWYSNQETEQRKQLEELENKMRKMKMDSEKH